MRKPYSASAVPGRYRRGEAIVYIDGRHEVVTYTSGYLAFQITCSNCLEKPSISRMSLRKLQPPPVIPTSVVSDPPTSELRCGIYSVPTPFFLLSVILAPSSPLSLSLAALRLNAFHSSARKSFPFFSVIRFFNHSFWVCSCSILCSSCAVLSFSSFAVFSRACSRCFFFTRKRAEAAVFRRRLSSSAAWRDDSSWVNVEPGVEALAVRLLPGAGDD